MSGNVVNEPYQCCIDCIGGVYATILSKSSQGHKNI